MYISISVQQFTGNSAKIETLGGSNYDTWKLRMQGVLVKNKVWAYISGAKSKPVPGGRSPYTGRCYSHCAKEEKDFKARADLFLNINEVLKISERAARGEVLDKYACIRNSLSIRNQVY